MPSSGRPWDFLHSEVTGNVATSVEASNLIYIVILEQLKWQSHCFSLQRRFVLSFPIIVGTFLLPHINLLATTQQHLTSTSHTYCTVRTSTYIQYTTVTMSSENTPTNATVASIEVRFPHQHIQAFGAGEVGRVYVTLSPSGNIIKAEADLAHAPFKKMLIDDPKILKIFGQRADGIGIDIKLLHPAARFRLDPLEIRDDEDGELDTISFDIGRLVDITHLPTAAKYGWSEHHLSKADLTEEGEVHKRVRLIVEDEEQKKLERQGLKRKAPGARPQLTQTRTQRKEAGQAKAEKAASMKPSSTNGRVRQAVKADTKPEPYLFSPASNPGAVIKVKKPEPASSTPRPWLPTPDSEHSTVASKRLPKIATNLPPPRKGRNTGPVPNTAKGQKMGIPYNEIMARLSAPDQAIYEDMVTTERRIAARSGFLREALATRIHAFVHMHDFVGLHNAYAEALKRSGSNKAFQLPVFEERAHEKSDETDPNSILAEKRQGSDGIAIGKVAAQDNQNNMLD